jgi:hypothetical protein
MWIALFTIVFSFLILPTANAYVDPASGSYVFQVLIGVFVGIGLGLKLFWRKIVSIFTRSGSKKVERSEVK